MKQKYKKEKWVVRDKVFNEFKIKWSNEPWLWEPRKNQWVYVENIKDEYVASNVTSTRTIDVSTATLTDLANIVWTLIEDLQKINFIKK